MADIPTPDGSRTPSDPPPWGYLTRDGDHTDTPHLPARAGSSGRGAGVVR